MRLITFSGHVTLHNPHWTHASSTKRSIGQSGLSSSAPVGQALTQDRHSVQPSVSTSSVPKGAPGGSGRMSTGAARHGVEMAQRQHRHAALVAHRQEGRGTRAVACGQSVKRRLDRVGIVAVDDADTTLAEAEAAHDRFAQPELARESSQLLALLRVDQQADGRGAEGERHGEELDAELRRLVDGERQDARGQAASVARHQRDQLLAVAAVMHQQHGGSCRRPSRRP